MCDPPRWLKLNMFCTTCSPVTPVSDGHLILDTFYRWFPLWTEIVWSLDCDFNFGPLYDKICNGCSFKTRTHFYFTVRLRVAEDVISSACNERKCWRLSQQLARSGEVTTAVAGPAIIRVTNDVWEERTDSFQTALTDVSVFTFLPLICLIVPILMMTPGILSVIALFHLRFNSTHNPPCLSFVWTRHSYFHLRWLYKLKLYATFVPKYTLSS